MPLYVPTGEVIWGDPRVVVPGDFDYFDEPMHTVSLGFIFCPSFARVLFRLLIQGCHGHGKVMEFLKFSGISEKVMEFFAEFYQVKSKQPTLPI